MATSLETRNPFGNPRRLDEIMNNEQPKTLTDPRGPPVWKLFVPKPCASPVVDHIGERYGYFISQKFVSD
jgi:hypothetical protein